MSARRDWADHLRRRVDEWASSYASQGYEVHTGDDLPPIWREALPFQPDLLAVRPDDRVVVEFKSRHRRKSWDRVREHAQAIDGMRGWRFELVVVDPEFEPAYPVPMQMPDAEYVASLVSEARAAASAGASEAAFLTAWTAFEAALLLALEDDLPMILGRQAALLKAAYAASFIDEDAHRVAQALARHRNAIAHGMRPQMVTEASYQDVLDLVSHVQDVASQVERDTDDG